MLYRFHEPEGEKQYSTDELEQGFERKAHNAKREQDKPDQREQEEHQQRYGPAQHQQHKPEYDGDESSHAKDI